MSTTSTCTRGYTNVPPYETAPLAQVKQSAKFAYATRLSGVGAFVEHGYASAAEARRQRENARRRQEWTSHLLERVGPREWVPADPRIRTMYALPANA